MKALLVAHGYPPELVGGTEVSVQSLARGLARRGHEVVVVAGSIAHEEGFRASTAMDGEVRVRRIHRADLYFDHWQKAASARVGASFREILREERPDLVHVNHWIRLTRDLVFLAAAEGFPAAVTLHDLWTSCLVTFRVRPDTKEFCEAPLGPSPCVACAGLLPPRTPWVPLDAQFLAAAEHRLEIVRELELARAVIVPTRGHAETIAGFLGLDAERLALEVVPHGRDLSFGPRAARPPGDTLVLGAWGHLHPLKGQDLLLDAIGRLEDPRRVALHLAGGEADPDFARRLRAAADGLDVTFHGPFELDGLDHHPVTDVHAMVSGTRARETWGLVIDEAVALRLPLVLPRTGAYAERLDEGRGALFYAPNDAGSLAGVLARLVADPALVRRLGESLPSTESVVPSVDTHVDRVLDVYADVVAAGPPARPVVDWWSARLRIAAEEQWDESLRKRSAEELGFA